MASASVPKGFQRFVDELDSGIEFIRFDVPGTGGSPTPTMPYCFSMLCCLIVQVLDQLGYKQVDVLGISWGGGLAQQCLSISPTLSAAASGQHRTRGIYGPRSPIRTYENGNSTALYGSIAHDGHRSGHLWRRSAVKSRVRAPNGSRHAI
jgi:pimeloyl-ACP methyl ester carboxylesterase